MSTRVAAIWMPRTRRLVSGVMAVVKLWMIETASDTTANPRLAVTMADTTTLVVVIPIRKMSFEKTKVARLSEPRARLKFLFLVIV